MTICPICNAFFTPPPRRRGSPQIYCSQTCRRKAAHAMGLARNRAHTAARLAEVEPVVCASCERVWFKPKSDVHKYCSIKCRRQVEHQRHYNKKRKHPRQNAARQIATPSIVLTSD